MDFDVRTRKGTYVKFDVSQVFNAIKRINDETKELTDNDIKNICNLVVSRLGKLNKKHISTIDINDIIEELLFTLGHKETGRALVLYRSIHNRLVGEIKN